MLGVPEVGGPAREPNEAFARRGAPKRADYIQIIEKFETSLRAA
jgi:hypothetical protein